MSRPACGVRDTQVGEEANTQVGEEAIEVLEEEDDPKGDGDYEEDERQRFEEA